MAKRVISAVLTLKDKDFSSGVKKAANSTDDFQRKMKYAQNQAKRFKDNTVAHFKSMALGVAGAVSAAFAVDKIKDFGFAAVESAANAAALNAQFEQVFAGLEKNAFSSLNKIAEETGILPTRLQESFTRMAAFAKTTGMETADALALTERATLAAADSAAFYDRSIEEVTENLQSFLKGNYENDAALGISATETTRNAKANELYGKSFNDLSEAQKQLTLLAMVEDGNKLAGALGQAARESDGFENQIGNVKQAWMDFKAELATPMLNMVTSGLGNLTERIQGIDGETIGKRIKSGIETVRDIAIPTFDAIKTGLGWIKEHGTTIISITSGIASAFIAFKAITAISTAFTVLSAALTAYRTAGLGAAAAQLGLNTAMLASPVTWIAVGIGALVAAGIYLWKNWDTVKEKTTQLWSKIRENPIGKFLTQPIQNAIYAGKWLYQNFDLIKQKAGELWQRLLDNPMLALVAGPIGGLIAAGITLYKNWDTIKEKASELWEKVQEVFGGIYEWGSTKIQGVVGFFQNLYDKFTDFKNAISNFEPPEWVSSIGGAIDKGINWVTNKINGSHATGLNKVPFDGYIAELHKGEMVIPSRQAERLRNAGLNVNNVDKPIVNRNNTTNVNRQTTNTVTTEQVDNSRSVVIQNLIVNAKGVTTDEVISELVPQLKLALQNM